MIKKLEELFGLTPKELGVLENPHDCSYFNTIDFYTTDSHKFTEDFVQYILAYGYRIKEIFIYNNYTIEQFRIIRRLIRQNKIEQASLFGNFSRIPHRFINEIMKLGICVLNNFSYKAYTKLILNGENYDKYICYIVINPITSYICLQTSVHLIKNTKIHDLRLYYKGYIDLVFNELLSAISDSSIKKLRFINSKRYKEINNYTVNILNNTPNLQSLYIDNINADKIDENTITNVCIQRIIYPKLIKTINDTSYYRKTVLKLDRNIRIQETITQVICLLILAGSKPTSILFSLPTEIIFMIANLILQSRSDPIWINISKQPQIEDSKK